MQIWKIRPQIKISKVGHVQLPPHLADESTHMRLLACIKDLIISHMDGIPDPAGDAVELRL